MLKVIRSEVEYQSALADLDDLLEEDPRPGTAEADRLEVLAVLIEDYESETWPESLPSPVEAIRFRMEQEGLRQRDLIPYFGSASRVSEVLSGKRGLSISMIRALAEGLQIPARVLIREEPSSDVDEEIDWSLFPVNEMVRRGWVDSTALRSAAAAASALQEFFAPIDESLTLAALYRTTRHVRTGREIDEPALMAWTARILADAEEQQLDGEYESGSVTPDFMRELAKLSWADNAPVLAQEFLSRHGIAMVVEPHLPGTHLDGAAILTAPRRPVVGLTIRYDRIDNFWFVLMHELAHISLHSGEETDAFFDDLDVETEEKLEEEADSLAAEVLIPDAAWRESPASRLRTAGAAQNLARKLGIHPAIVAGRMRHHFGSYHILSQLVGHGEVRSQFPAIEWPS